MTTVTVTEPIGFGFKRVFDNFLVYAGINLIFTAIVIATLIMGGVTGVLSDEEIVTNEDLIKALVFVAVLGFIWLWWQVARTRVALRDVAGEGARWSNAFTGLPIIGAVVAYFLTACFGVIVVGLPIAGAALLFDVHPAFTVLLGIAAVVLAFLVYPVVVLVPVYVIDRAANPFEAFGRVFKDFKGCYWTVLGSITLLRIINSVLSLFTLNLSLFVTYPAESLAFARIYQLIRSDYPYVPTYGVARGMQPPYGDPMYPAGSYPAYPAHPYPSAYPDSPYPAPYPSQPYPSQPYPGQPYQQPPYQQPPYQGPGTPGW